MSPDRSHDSVYLLDAWPVSVPGGVPIEEKQALKELAGLWAAQVEIPASFFGGGEGVSLRDEILLEARFDAAVEESPRRPLEIRVRSRGGYVHPRMLAATVFEGEIVAESHDKSMFLRLRTREDPAAGELHAMGMGRMFNLPLHGLTKA